MTTLPKTVRFQDIELSVIDRDGTPWLTSPQIADALGARDRRAVSDIHKRHRDEFTDAMTAVVRHGRSRVRIFSPRGAHLIAMFARTPRAKAFRQWVLDVLEARPSVPAGRPFRNRRRYLVVMEAGKVTDMLELSDESLIPTGRIATVRQNAYLLHRQLSVLLGEANADLLEVPMAEFRDRDGA